MSAAVTRGVHHIGLTVSRLKECAEFFTNIPGWQEIKRRDDYPAIFVGDGNVMITLWQIREMPAVDFNKDRNVGLQHVAFSVDSENKLAIIYQKLVDQRVEIEFAPEPLGQGMAKHMMCYEPSGNRIACIWPGQGNTGTENQAVH